MTDFSREEIELWVALGSAQQCVENINRFIEAGARTLTIRFPSKQQEEQLNIFVDEILPSFG